MKGSFYKDPRNRFFICIAAGVAFGLANDNLAVGISLGVVFGLLAPATSFDVSLLRSNDPVSVFRVALACFVVGIGVGVTSLISSYLTGFTVGFFHGLFA